MPVPKRYFHCSQDLNHDPELWQFTSEFGDRSLRTWLQILVYLDKTGNQWRTTGDWVATLSRTVRQSVANVSRQIRWLTANKWLAIREVAADGSTLVLESPNWLKYNRSQEHKGSGTNPDKGACKDPLPSFPSPTPNPSVPTPKDKEKKEEKRVARSRQLSDEEFLASLKSNPAYQHIDFKVEDGKMDVWLGLHPGRQKTRKFIVNWLNKIDRPMKSGNGSTAHAPIPPFPPANDPIGRGMWRRAYGDPPKAEA